MSGGWGFKKKSDSGRRNNIALSDHFVKWSQCDPTEKAAIDDGLEGPKYWAMAQLKRAGIRFGHLRSYTRKRKVARVIPPQEDPASRISPNAAGPPA